MSHPIRPSARASTSLLLFGFLATGAMLAGCSSTDSAEVVGGGQDINDDGSRFFFGDENSGGAAQAFKLTTVTYGRLVQVFGLNEGGIQVPMGQDFVINQNLVSDGVDYVLSTNGVTGQESLLIPRNVEDADSRLEFLELLRAAGENLNRIQTQDLDTSGVFSMLPRNAAVVLKFDDLLEPSTVSRQTIELVTGYPPSAPFEARLLASPFYGGTVNGEFYPTRVVIDLTTSEIENFLSSGAVIPPNGVGLPASIEINGANVQLRIPTRRNASVGLTKVLTNRTDHTLDTQNNGPVDFSSQSQPVTRAIRAGGRPDVVSDPFNGFIRDVTPPVVVGSTPVDIPVAPMQIRADPTDTDSLLFTIPRIEFASELCGSAPAVDDIIVQNDVFARVVQNGSTPVSGVVENVLVQLVLFPPAWSGPQEWEIFGAAAASYESTFAAQDVARAGCYVSMLPTPDGFPEDPTSGVATGAILSLRFSEPMDPASLTAFDSVTVTRSSQPDSEPLPTSDYVVGSLSQSASLREVTFVPNEDFAHTQGLAEPYFFGLADASDAFPPRDLAGNIVETLPEIEFSIKSSDPSRFNGGRVSRFSSTDEELPENYSEWGGQIQLVADRQVIRARPVIRSRVVLDNQEQPLMQQMTTFPQGVVTPFSPFGSKMQTLWRYADCGFSLTDPQNINIDIEQLAWAPSGGTITPDAFSQFEIRLSHSLWAPDEIISSTSLFPRYQNSGLAANYAGNVLGEQVVVHPRERGYTMDQGDLFQTVNGTTLMPFPLNRDPDVEKSYFTWRDTSIRLRAGNRGNGVEPETYPQALGIDPSPNQYYRRDEVQTIGLPLLMEFRTFLDLSAIGQNGWVLNLAVNSSAKPYFRAFTTGGVNTTGTQVFVDPDSETAANGGFNPGSTPPGRTTFGLDNSVHLGAIDYVTRVSRAHSIWFEATIESEGTFAGRRYSEPTIEPSIEDQPNGTDLVVNYRGATAITFSDLGDGVDDPTPEEQDNFSGPPEIAAIPLTDYQYDAFSLDLYGDYYNDVDATQTGMFPHSPDHSSQTTASIPLVNFGLEFLPSTDTIDGWRETVDEIAGARFYQVRLTFLGNTATGQGAEVSAFAMTWSQQ